MSGGIFKISLKSIVKIILGSVGYLSMVKQKKLGYLSRVKQKKHKKMHKNITKQASPIKRERGGPASFFSRE
jgi:hypothetical protein